MFVLMYTWWSCAWSSTVIVHILGFAYTRIPCGHTNMCRVHTCIPFKHTNTCTFKQEHTRAHERKIIRTEIHTSKHSTSARSAMQDRQDRQDRQDSQDRQDRQDRQSMCADTVQGQNRQFSTNIAKVKRPDDFDR